MKFIFNGKRLSCFRFINHEGHQGTKGIETFLGAFVQPAHLT